jgi:hypothetical protein
LIRLMTHLRSSMPAQAALSSSCDRWREFTTGQWRSWGWWSSEEE